MKKFICKCGKEIEKSTNAASTGNRLENYGPGHECYGCPFVIALKEYGGGSIRIVGHECRMSKTIDYTTFADLKLGTTLCGKIRSLDLEFLKKVRAYADTINGIVKDRYAFYGRPAEYGADGRYALTIMVDPNKKGQEAKKKLFDAFFDEDGRRLDMAPQAEEEHVKAWLKGRIDEEKLVMLEMNEAPGLEADELPVDEIEEQTEIPDLTEEPTEALAEEIGEELTEEIAEEEPSEESAEPAHVTGRRVSITSPEFEPVIYKIDDIIVRALRTAVDAHQGFTVTAKIQFTPIGSRFTVSHNVGYKFEPIKVEEKGGLYEDLLVELDADGNPIIPDGSAQQITLDEVSGATVTTDPSGVVQSVELDDADHDRIFPCKCTECPLHTGFTGGESGCSFGGDVNAPLDSDLEGHIYDAVTIHRCTRGCILEICDRVFPAEQPEPDPYPCTEECYLCDFGEYCDLREDGSSRIPYEDKHIIEAVENFNCPRRFPRRRYAELIKEADSDD